MSLCPNDVSRLALTRIALKASSFSFSSLNKLQNFSRLVLNSRRVSFTSIATVKPFASKHWADWNRYGAIEPKDLDLYCTLSAGQFLDVQKALSILRALM